MKRVGLIGCGGIAADLIAAVESAPAPLKIVGALARTGGADAARKRLPDLIIVESVNDLLALTPDIVVEVAGQGAVGAYAETVLRAGVDLVVVSIGALAAPGMVERLQSAARDNGARLILPAGAIAGIDALAAMRLRGLHTVRYRGLKPPRAWRGSPAERQFDLDALTERTVLFAGTAREAALAFPENANVAATVALAGLGLDATRVELVADPASRRNLHEIEAAGETGELHLQIRGLASARNPKTSALTALSVARALINEAATIVI